MKRCLELQPLSREHQAALSLGREAQRAAARDDAAIAAAAAQVRERYAADLARHFAIEEAVLLPALEAAGECAGPRRARREHATLQALACALARPNADDLAAFGERLVQHVRFEERALFPQAEALLDPAALGRVAAACVKG